MQKIFPFFFIILLVSCTSKGDSISVEVSNPSSFDRFGEIIELNISDLSTLKTDSLKSYLVYEKSGKLLSSQVTYDSKLLFLADVKANTTTEFTIKIGERQEYMPKVFGRYYPERKDDFSWENDRVGFRLYGHSLKEIQAPTNGMDLWYKRTSELVLDKWYADDLSGKASYHEDHGEGCDPYAVGSTLGAGTIAPYVDGSLIRNENYESYEILDNGPLRFTFRLNYPDLKISDTLSVKDEKTILLDAGSQLTKIIQDYGNISLSVAAGIVKRLTNRDSLIVSDSHNYLIYQEPHDEKNGQIYLSLVFPDKFDHSTIDSYQLDGKEYQHTLAVKEYKGEPITYYTGFGWNKFGFARISDFEKYIQEFDQKLEQPLIIKIKEQ